MANLQPLIRLRKYRTEEKQKALAELFRQADLLEGRKRILLGDMERERKIAEESDQLDGFVAYLSYAARLKKEIEKIDVQIARMTARIEKAQDDIREAFSEQKKIEIIQRRRDEEEAQKEDKKESATLDEVGIETFRRREEGE
ncbi:MAG: flagellar FliJ family protein [Pseudobdellovibrionaceae bacterium]